MKTLSEWESKRRLADLPYPREALTGSREEAERFVSALGKPVVAKASGVAHKTEGGLVRFGVTASTVGPIWDQLAAAGDGKVLLAEQVAAELELIVGGYRDPSFGPLVTIGIGGIAAEIFGDVVALLAMRSRNCRAASCCKASAVAHRLTSTPWRGLWTPLPGCWSKTHRSRKSIATRSWYARARPWSWMRWWCSPTMRAPESLTNSRIESGPCRTSRLICRLAA